MDVSRICARPERSRDENPQRPARAGLLLYRRGGRLSTTPRFFVEAALAAGTSVALPADVAHHATRVLRLRAGDEVALFNGRGGEYRGRLETDGIQLRVQLERHLAIERESPLAITLVQSWIAADKLDWVVEKAVELGVAAILLAPAARSVVRLDPDRRQRRVRRLKEIAVAACSQSGRNVVPGVGDAPTLREALEAARPASVVGLMLDPAADQPALSALAAASAVSLAIGPEGGFDDAERALATSLGYRAVSLGPRILRTETAGLAALAAFQSAAGDLK